jgi:hypothetical protein
MFNLLISFSGTAWETDQLMRMDTDRFLEFNGDEAKNVSLKKPETLKALKKAPALLMYERGAEGPSADIVRYGRLSGITVSGKEPQLVVES